MQSPLAKRIEEIIAYYKLNQESFGKSLGVSRASVNQWVKGKDEGGTEPAALMKITILEKYPGINANWFLFGKGSITSDVKTTFDEYELLSTLDKSDHPLIKFLTQQNKKADQQVENLIGLICLTCLLIKGKKKLRFILYIKLSLPIG